MKYSVYEIKFPDGYVYVGCTKDIHSRMKQHENTNHELLSKRVDSYGIKNQYINIISSFGSKEKAFSTETEYRTKYQKENRSLNLSWKGSTSPNDTANVIFKLNESLKNRFKKKCIDNTETQQDAMNRLVRHYVDTNGQLHKEEK